MYRFDDIKDNTFLTMKQDLELYKVNEMLGKLM